MKYVALYVTGQVFGGGTIEGLQEEFENETGGSFKEAIENNSLDIHELGAEVKVEFKIEVKTVSHPKVIKNATRK